jgi:hypothetical protein
MSGVVRIFSKAAAERRRLYLDYSCWLEPDEELSDFQVSVSPYTSEAPVVMTVGYPDAEHKKLMCYAAGGLKNTSYLLRMVVRTDAGQVKQDDFGLRVTP